MKNKEIKSNLESLFNQNFNLIKDITFKSIIDGYLEETNNYYLSIGIKNYLKDNEAINLNNYKKDKNLIEVFKKAKNISIDESAVVVELISDIKKSISKSEMTDKKISNQIVFLEHNFEFIAYFNAYVGDGNYPVLKTPTYFDFDLKEELYVGLGKVDYTIIWKNIIQLNKLLEEFDILEIVEETELYQNLFNSYKFKTYLLLFKAFNQIGIDKIEKPLYIYGNEYGCEPINIFIYE